MAVVREHNQPLTDAEIQSLSTGDMLKLVLDTESAAEIRRFARARFAVEAAMMNDKPEAPFILWPAINKEPRQPWLPVALAKVARAEIPRSHRRDVVATIPSSATWYGEQIRAHHLYNGAVYPLVAKAKQLEALSLNPAEGIRIDVPSYVHNRQLDGTRGTQDMWFFTPEIYQGASLTLFDDALAEGYTGMAVARFAREELGVAEVHLAVPMAKAVQGGRERIMDSGLIDSVSTLITVTATHGQGGTIQYE